MAMGRGTKRKAMRTGTKRKAIVKKDGAVKLKEERKINDQNKTIESNNVLNRRRAKRARVTIEEYCEEKRNMEDLWQQTFLVGTEWDAIDFIYHHEHKWSFRSLELAFEEGGDLYGQRVYLFGCSEAQFISDQKRVVLIPIVVAVQSPFSPSDRLGITSVQSASEEIVPMKQMKMDWVPFIPLENRDSQIERLKLPIFILGCKQRKAGLRQTNINRSMKFQYCLPYFYNPLKEDKFENSTEVQIMYPDTEPPIVCVFDWELDEVDEFADNLIVEDQLPSDLREKFMQFVNERVGEARKSNRETRNARRRALEEMDEETRDAFKNIKFYKFYPDPNVVAYDKKSAFINRYYGNAHKVL